MRTGHDLIALTRKLISFDTTNPPGSEQACAEYAAGLLEEAGFSMSLHSFTAMAHKTDEYCYTANIEAAGAAILEIARRTCGG